MPEDLLGRRFGLLVAIQMTGKRTRNVVWLCRCDCGAEVEVSSDKLKLGRKVRCSWANHPGLSRIHALTYISWRSMIGRCHSGYVEPKTVRNYRDRGIVVCERWRDSFLAFLEDMGDRPDATYTIDRINNDGNYEPSNCRWATKAEQRRNSRQRLDVLVALSSEDWTK